MKKSGYILITLGILTILFFAFADALGAGKDGGVGAAQFLGFQIGAVLILLGIGFVIIKWEGEHKNGGNRKSFIDTLIGWPAVVWVLIPFVVEFIFFSLAPMFLTGVRIRYFTRYIPDSYITHIGFDLESTVSRIGTWLATGQSPYADGFLLYTPFVFVLFAPLVMLGYPAYYRLVVMSSLASYCAVFLLSMRLVPRKNKALLVLFFVLGLVSYGFQFELERGQFNIIAFAAAMLAVYIFHFHHKFRYFAYLLFSLAVQLKLYPAIFILMFVKDWRNWKENIRRFVGLGLANFALLFVLGYQFFTTFLTRVTSVQFNYQSSRSEDLSMTGFVYHLTTDGYGLFGGNSLETLAQFSGLIRLAFLLVFGVCLFSLLAHVYRQRQSGFNPYLFFVCAVGALVLPSQSADYKLSILAAPFAIVLCSLPELVERRTKLAQIGLVLLASTAYWSTFYSAKFKPYLLSRNFPALFVMLLAVTLLHFLVRGRFESRSVEDSQVEYSFVHGSHG